MKKLLSILFVFIAFTASAQKIDTVKNGILVTPVVIDALMNDTVYQVNWEAYGLKRKDTTGCTVVYQLFDRKGRMIREKPTRVPYSVTSVWLDDVVIDNYILTLLGLKKR